MPDIIVQRNAGNMQGEDIIDPLLTTLDVCLVRGRMELDEACEALQPIALDVLYRDGVRCGQVVEVFDEFFGEVWYGKIIGISHQFSGVELTTSLKVAKPSSYEV